MPLYKNCNQSNGIWFFRCTICLYAWGSYIALVITFFRRYFYQCYLPCHLRKQQYTSVYPVAIIPIWSYFPWMPNCNNCNSPQICLPVSSTASSKCHLRKCIYLIFAIMLSLLISCVELKAEEHCTNVMSGGNILVYWWQNIAVESASALQYPPPSSSHIINLKLKKYHETYEIYKCIPFAVTLTQTWFWHHFMRKGAISTF